MLYESLTMLRRFEEWSLDKTMHLIFQIGSCATPFVQKNGQEFVGLGSCVRPHHHSTLRITLKESVFCYVL